MLLSTIALQAQPVFIGTGETGVYLAHFDAEKGVLSEPALAAEYKAPGFLDKHPELPILYSVGSDNTVGAFTIGEDNNLSKTAPAPVQGSNPCHIAVDASGRTVATANYSDGSVTTIRLGSDGKPGEIASFIKNEGSGPHERQNAPHAHGVYFDNANRLLFVPDLGTDQILIYKFDPTTSKITPSDPPAYKTAPGAGPRHMTFSPDEKHAYIINELDNTIHVAGFDSRSGTLSAIHSVPTLPEDYQGNNTTAEIEVHPSGNFVYGSNRGHDSIVVYKRDPESGKLSHVQHAPCGGRQPRHFKIDPTGKWLICGHQGSNTISVLSLDSDTGKLGEPKSTVKAPKPICILFP